MRTGFLCFFTLAAVLIALSPCYAESSTEIIAPSPASPADRLTIVEDEAVLAFRFLIDGREVARIDTNGVVVMKEMNRSDASPTKQDGQINEPPKAEPMRKAP